MVRSLLFLTFLVSCVNESPKNIRIGEKDTLNLTQEEKMTDSTLKINYQSEYVSFEDKDIAWSVNEIKNRADKKYNPFTVKRIESSDSITTIIVEGTGIYGYYKGNCRIKSDSLQLYYWLDESKDFTNTSSKHTFVYKIKNSEHKQYSISLSDLTK